MINIHVVEFAYYVLFPVLYLHADLTKVDVLVCLSEFIINNVIIRFLKLKFF